MSDLFKEIYKQDKYSDIKGSPFYLEDWKLADLELNDGKHFDKVRVKVNLYTQEVICMSVINTEITLKDGITSRLQLYDTTESRQAVSHVFTSRIPLVETDTTYPIFEVITEGKATLLNLIKKKILKISDAMSPSNEKEFVSFETLCIYHNSELKKCEKNSDFYTRLLSDKKDLLENFIKEKKLKCRNRKEVETLIEFYNSI